jgi:hypothetical protein
MNHIKRVNYSRLSQNVYKLFMAPLTIFTSLSHYFNGLTLDLSIHLFGKKHLLTSNNNGVSYDASEFNSFSRRQSFG